MKQVTWVALYGEKSTEFSDAILQCQQQITHLLGDAFQPYDLWQVHATILGLERIHELTYENRNFFQFRGESKTMNLAGFLNWIRSNHHIPFHIQIGGFEDRDYPFVSRGQKPYDRTFSIQGNKAVLMGWSIQKAVMGEDSAPQDSPQYPNILDEIRRSAQQFNILHSYHRQPTDTDNDFYLRIGLVNSSALHPPMVKTLEKTIRQCLGQMKPLILEVNPSRLYLAAYTDETLPKTSTNFWAIEDDILTPSFLEGLYQT